MRVNVGELLADRHATRVFSFSERMEPPGEEIALPGLVEGEIVLSGTGRTVVLTGQVRTVVGLVCGSCLVRFEQPLAVAVTEEFRRPGPEEEERSREELQSEDFLLAVEPGDMIDVTEVVRQNIALALPIAPRCHEDCRGLCPHCGADRNRVACGCAHAEIDPRLAPLAQWASRGRPPGGAPSGEGVP
jgi:uncharacterized protein